MPPEAVLDWQLLAVVGGEKVVEAMAAAAGGRVSVLLDTVVCLAGCSYCWHTAAHMGPATTVAHSGTPGVSEACILPRCLSCIMEAVYTSV